MTGPGLWDPEPILDSDPGHDVTAADLRAALTEAPPEQWAAVLWAAAWASPDLLRAALTGYERASLRAAIRFVHRDAAADTAASVFRLHTPAPGELRELAALPACLRILEASEAGRRALRQTRERTHAHEEAYD